MVELNISNRDPGERGVTIVDSEYFIRVTFEDIAEMVTLVEGRRVKSHRLQTWKRQGMPAREETRDLIEVS